MGNKLNLTGQQFGKLTVLEELSKRQNGQVVWKCYCECGNICEVSSGNLRSELVRSCGCLRKLPKGEAAFNWLFRDYKRNAVKRNLSFSLSKEEFRNLVTQNCHYCGQEPSCKANPKRGNGSFVYTGIDRVDNSQGYSVDNVIPCCKRCNRAKSNDT